jgi:hypothetical protein
MWKEGSSVYPNFVHRILLRILCLPVSLVDGGLIEEEKLLSDKID